MVPCVSVAVQWEGCDRSPPCVRLGQGALALSLLEKVLKKERFPFQLAQALGWNLELLLFCTLPQHKASQLPALAMLIQRSISPSVSVSPFTSPALL